MNHSSKLLKYLEGMRLVEMLLDDERAIFSLFGLSFDLTADTVLGQQEEFKKQLLLRVILELLDYNVDEVSDPKNYTGTGKLQYELYKFGDEKIIDVLYAIFGEKLNGTFRELYDNHILVKVKKIASNARENVDLLHNADPEIYEENFPNLINHYDWTELETAYKEDKKKHSVTMEWLQEKQERELQKVLELDIMHYADEPSTQTIEDSDFPYHRSFLSHKFKPSVDYKEAYTKYIRFATRQEGMIIPKLGEYCKYIAIYINKFRPEQKKALFGIIKMFDLIHADMVRLNPELAKYLGYPDPDLETLDDTDFYAPARFLTEMLQGDWFEKFRTSGKYNKQWCKDFITQLMKSEHNSQIACEWKRKSSRLAMKASIIACLKEAGVIKGSDLSIASAIIKDKKESSTFARYMGRGKEKPYLEWIINYVNQE